MRLLANVPCLVDEGPGPRDDVAEIRSTVRVEERQEERDVLASAHGAVPQRAGRGAHPPPEHAEPGDDGNEDDAEPAEGPPPVARLMLVPAPLRAFPLRKRPRPLTTGRPRVGPSVSAIGAEIFIAHELLPHVARRPVQHAGAPVLVRPVVGRIPEQPEGVKRPRQRLADVAAVVPAPAVLPVIVVEAVSNPCVIDERLVADPRSVHIVAGAREVVDPIGAVGHCVTLQRELVAPVIDVTSALRCAARQTLDRGVHRRSSVQSEDDAWDR